MKSSQSPLSIIVGGDDLTLTSDKNGLCLSFVNATLRHEAYPSL